MLVLSRLDQQRTRIVVPPSTEPTVVWVSVTSIKQNRKVGLGFETDNDQVEFMREEIISHNGEVQ